MIKKSLQLLKRTFTRPRGLDIDSVYPVSDWLGEDRGTPIDRYYIEKFLYTNREYIHGSALEVANDKYIRKFGMGTTSLDVLHPVVGSHGATVIGDLTNPSTLPEGKFDCFVCTQTIHVIFKYMEAIKGAYRILKPGGTMLATLGAIAQISRFDMTRWGDYWRFTTLSAQMSFQEVFGKENIQVNYYGNCLAAVSLLRGIAVEELSVKKLDIQDLNYPVIITVVATKK
ncbi:MAG TPA: methyltransferase domain-containing protein [Puia sp.]|nr:methyltransferase domain-containing protein [Puia sp.]